VSLGPQVSLGIMLMEGVLCGGVAARVGDAVQSGKFNSILEDFGATGPDLLINNSILRGNGSLSPN
jgi:hypothetical protein